MTLYELLHQVSFDEIVPFIERYQGWNALALYKIHYDYLLHLIINRIADLTVFVIRAGNIDRRQLPEVERLYQENVLKNMAVVLNGSSLKPAYGYGYTDPKARHHHHKHKNKSLWKRLLKKLKK